MKKLTPAQIKSAKAFLAAFNAFTSSTPANRADADWTLGLAVFDYRVAHNLSDSMGLLDCINHFNRTHATQA
jgi:hypothetical protein